ncbi:MAG: carbohydrate ABC transporter substrate-binding protein [Clostridia bacterium]|nr:carbohydrate ABC transporter substrate-binding protein [Clostridia bacterium]
MFSKVKKWICYVLVVVCFGSLVYKAAVTGNDSRKVVLSFWGTNLPYQYALEYVAAEYNKTQDDFEVVIDRQDAGNYRTWMGARLAGGNASDILATTIVYGNTDAANGYLCDLSDELSKPNPYNEGEESWADSFGGTYLTQVAYAADTSQYYCVPTSTVSVRIMINKDMLKKNGVEIPDENWTFSDFRRICEKLEAKGITAMEIANAKFINYMVSWMIDIFMAQLKYDDINGYDRNTNGQVETEEIVRAFLDGEDVLNLATDTDFAETMRFLKTWSKYWGDGYNSRSDTSENFLRQSVPMFFSGSWGVSGVELTLNNDNPDADKTNPYTMFDYVSLPFPKLEKETYIDADNTFTFTNLKEGLPFQELGEPSGCFCIPKSTADNGKYEVAVDFLKYLTSQKGASIMAERAYEIPVTKGVQVSEKMSDFLPPENSESVKFRFNLLNLADGVAEEYHFKQVQNYLMGELALNRKESKNGRTDGLMDLIQKKYLEVTQILRDDNEWEW